MPCITDRSEKSAVVKTKGLNHGTLGCTNLARTRQFYEEVLGLDVVQTSPISMMVGKGAPYVYAVVETPAHKNDMELLNHNGLEVETPEEVDAAYAALKAIKDEWGLNVQKPVTMHGLHTFYFRDFDGNWWEIVSAGKEGYQGMFHNKDYDLTGQHQMKDWVEEFETKKKLRHTAHPDDRAEFLSRRN
jgi:catechol 2,3-dioxygenase-like lactoylglutathione lyase family enzyme